MIFSVRVVIQFFMLGSGVDLVKQKVPTGKRHADFLSNILGVGDVVLKTATLFYRQEDQSIEQAYNIATESEGRACGEAWALDWMVTKRRNLQKCYTNRRIMLQNSKYNILETIFFTLRMPYFSTFKKYSFSKEGEPKGTGLLDYRTCFDAGRTMLLFLDTIRRLVDIDLIRWLSVLKLLNRCYVVCLVSCNKKSESSDGFCFILWITRSPKRGRYPRNEDHVDESFVMLKVRGAICSFLRDYAFCWSWSMENGINFGHGIHAGEPRSRHVIAAFSN